MLRPLPLLICLCLGCVLPSCLLVETDLISFPTTSNTFFFTIDPVPDTRYEVVSLEVGNLHAVTLDANGRERSRTPWREESASRSIGQTMDFSQGSGEASGAFDQGITIEAVDPDFGRVVLFDKSTGEQISARTRTPEFFLLDESLDATSQCAYFLNMRLEFNDLVRENGEYVLNLGTEGTAVSAGL